jgi:hypothetical protein
MTALNAAVGSLTDLRQDAPNMGRNFNLLS